MFPRQLDNIAARLDMHLPKYNIITPFPGCRGALEKHIGGGRTARPGDFHNFHTALAETGV